MSERPLTNAWQRRYKGWLNDRRPSSAALIALCAAGARTAENGINIGLLIWVT